MKQPVVISKEDLVFRMACMEDAEAVLALYRAASKSGETEWDDEYPNMNTIQFDLSIDGLYVLCHHNEIVGAVSMIDWDDLNAMQFWTPAKATVLARLCVHPQVRGAGLGRVMVEEIRRVAKACGFTATRHIASKYMEAPLRIYRSMGFRQVGEVSMFDTDYYAFELEL